MRVAVTQLNFLANTIIRSNSNKHNSPFIIRCCDSKPRGFGSSGDYNVKKKSSSKKKNGMLLQQSKSMSKQPTSMPGQAPGVGSKPSKQYDQSPSDLQFEAKLQAIKRSALEKKKVEKETELGVIDYDAPIERKQTKIGLGTQIGVGVAVVVFGLVFAFGDFLPSGNISSGENEIVSKKLSKEEKETLQSRLRQYEVTLASSPKDPVALEGAAVTLAELGAYDRASSFLEDLVKEKPSDPDVFRLLGEVKYEQKDYEASAAAYKSSARVSKATNFEVLRGLTNALLAAKKPDEAVQVLLDARERLSNRKLSDSLTKSEGSTTENDVQDIDPIQIELLLGKAYSDWGHFRDAVSVYDQLISSHPNDFRGYLAKGILMKVNGNAGDAERMFIQARFFAPEKVKALVDRYAGS